MASRFSSDSRDFGPWRDLLEFVRRLRPSGANGLGGIAEKQLIRGHLERLRHSQLFLSPAVMPLDGAALGNQIIC